MYTPRTYFDDTLIVSPLENPFIRQAALKYFLQQVYKILLDDCNHDRRRLEDLGYLAASRAAEDRIIPLLADLVERFVADFDALVHKRRALENITLTRSSSPYSISLHTFDSTRSGDSLTPVDATDNGIIPLTVARLPSKAIPYSDKVVLPPAVVPDVRRGLKIKTRGIANPVKEPAAIEPAAPDIVPLFTPYDLPKFEYNVTERIFSPQDKGKVSFGDFESVMTCKEIRFACGPGQGSRMKFLPPPNSGLKAFTLHMPHGGKDLNVNYVRRTLNEVNGWTMDSFRLRTRSN
ncbi:hypothetical protein DFH09DRAFT_37744 [Mycena vulgaris]|nr:hypothetical protein DFH09DRAFT_37744 [Mycena vulgaris]